MRLEDITPQWINQVVARFGRQRLAPCTDLTVEPLPNDRGQVHRLRLRYASGPGLTPGTLILKTPVGPTLPGGGRSMHDAGSREAYYFRHLAASSGFTTARCWAVDIDQASGASVLLFEDLADLGLRQGDRGSGIRRAEADTVIRRLAAFHALHWAKTQASAQREVRALTASVATAGDAAVRDYFRVAWPGVEACGLYELSPEVVRFGRGLMKDPTWARKQLTRSPQTILHGDLHVENMFFDDRTEPVGVTLIDWEDMAVGNGLLDVAWLVTTSVHSQDIDWEWDLVRSYFEGLREAGIQDYCWTECQADYRVAIENAFVQGILNCSIETNATPDVLAVEQELGQRYLLACQRGRPWELR